MARKTTTTPAVAWDVKRFVGKTFAFAGTFRRGECDRAARLIKADGGAVAAEVSETLDYLVVGKVSGKTTRAGTQAEKLNQTGQADIQIVSLQQFYDLFAPDRALAEVLFHAGKKAAKRWEQLYWLPGANFDLSGSDLRGFQANRGWYEHINFDDSDFRDADLTHCWFRSLCRVRMEKAKLVEASFDKLIDCRLCGADLREANLYKAVLERTDFTDANLESASLTGSQTKEMVFKRAKLTTADLEKAKLAGADFTEADISRASLEECDLSNAVLIRANLAGSDLTRAVLHKADLCGADLRGAVLVDADLTDARVEGADFTGANLTGAKLGGVDISQARGLTAPPSKRKAGRHLKELDAVALQAERFKTTAAITLPDGCSIPLTATYQSKSGKVRLASPKAPGYRNVTANTFSAGLLALVRDWLHGELGLDTIQVEATGPGLAVRGKELKRLVLAAWCEACGREVPAADQVQAAVSADQDRQEQRIAGIIGELRGGPAGIARWNGRSKDQRKLAGPFRGIDLSGAQLDGINLNWLEFFRANFENASLTGADLSWGSFTRANFRKANLEGVDLGVGKCKHADFAGASLRKAKLRVCDFTDACLRGADLTGADCDYANLRGADLSGAILKDVHLSSAKFDEKTRLPKGFVAPPEMIWLGTAVRARPKAARVPKGPVQALDRPAFLERLQSKVQSGKFANAVQMLKSERFYLFSQVEEGSLVGVVRSQSSAERVYACRLSRDGSFSCGTQNLRVCGGLGGAICKHLLVLIIGLANSGQLDLGEIDQWIDASLSQRPQFDRDEASAVLRYKGAEAGEVDWRPTETIPEDYYAL